MNKLLTNFPVTLTEEQKNVLKLTLSAVLQDDPITKYWRPTVYENGDIIWSLAASESEPLSQNIKGPSGFTPQFQIDQSTAEWEVTYDGTNWTPLGIIASGAQGPQGNPGKDGADGTDGKDGKDGTNGTSVYLDNVSTVAGGTQVTLGWGTSDTSAFVIPSGAAGAPGTDGISPAITTSELSPTEQHPQGGFAVTITDGTGSQTIDIWNGNNGAGATVRLLEGTGIKIEADGSDYTIGVSADYATKAYANEASAYALSAAETWVNQQNFATSAGLDADKQYAMTTNGWTDFVVPSTSGYLPLSGGTVTGLTTFSGSDFDHTLEIRRASQNNNYAHIGLNNSRGLSFKAFDDTQSHTLQLDMFPNQSNSNLIQLQHNGTSVGNLIPAQIHQGSYTPSENDGILHIILES